MAAHDTILSTGGHEEDADPLDVEENYSLGRKYGGEAKSSMKTYETKPNGAYKGGRRLKAWMRGAKG